MQAGNRRAAQARQFPLVILPQQLYRICQNP
jgi:hypothetical protein